MRFSEAGGRFSHGHISWVTCFFSVFFRGPVAEGPPEHCVEKTRVENVLDGVFCCFRVFGHFSYYNLSQTNWTRGLLSEGFLQNPLASDPQDVVLHSFLYEMSVSCLQIIQEGSHGKNHPQQCTLPHNHHPVSYTRNPTAWH